VEGERLAGYRLLQRLGAGGMGEVYLAQARGLFGVERPVAVKLIRDLHQQDETFTRLFVEEAKVSFLLTHPNVVQTYEFGEVEGRYFMVMEYVEGVSLSKLWRMFAEQLRQPLPLRFALHIIGQVARGLDYAHNLRAGDGSPLDIVHRDVSPGNILLSLGGHVKVSDFGLAKSALRAVHSEVGTVRGKVLYMPPEQLYGQPVDQRADIFPLGVMLFELLGGKSPFGDRRDVSYDSRRQASHRERLIDLAPHVPKAAAELVERCLAPHPADRPAAREVVAGSDRLLRDTNLAVADYELAEFVAEACALVADESRVSPDPGVAGMELRPVVDEETTGQRPTVPRFVTMFSGVTVPTHSGHAEPAHPPEETARTRRGGRASRRQ
jgi:serine/threonine-protein kinase